MAQAGAQARAQVKAQPMKWSNVINVYKYTWTPSFKGTLFINCWFDSWELWLTWASEILLQVTPPGFKLTCIEGEEAN